MNLLATTYFPSLCVAYIPIAFFPNHDFIDLLSNSSLLSTHILFGFLLDSFKVFGKALVIVLPFLSFKEK